MEYGIYELELEPALGGIPRYVVFYPAANPKETMAIFLEKNSAGYIPMVKMAWITPFPIATFTEDRLLERMAGKIKGMKKVAALDALADPFKAENLPRSMHAKEKR